MKRFIILITIILVFSLVPTALADDVDYVLTSHQIDPSVFSGAGQATITLSVQNKPNSPYLMDSTVVQYKGSTIGTFGKIYPGGVITKDMTVDIAASDIGKDIELFLIFNEDGADEKTIAISIYIPSDDTKPEVIFTRESPVTVARDGDTIVFHYYVKNIGNLDIEDLTITDTAFGEIATKDILKISDSTWDVSFSRKMDGDIVSKPTLEYTANNSKYTMVLDEMSVSYAAPSIEVLLTSDTNLIASGDNVIFTCVVKNDGNLDLYDVTLSGETMETPLQVTRLAVGKSYSFEFEVPVVSTTEFSFNVTATDEFGTFIDEMTEAIEITAQMGDVPVDMSINAVVTNSALTSPEEVTFNLLIINSGLDPIIDVKLFANDELIQEIETLEVGEMELTYTAMIDQPIVYTFKLAVELIDGTEIISTSKPIDFTVLDPDEDEYENVGDTSTDKPEVTAAPDEADIDGEEGNNLTTMIIIILVAVIALIAVIILLISNNVRGKRRKD